MVRMRCKYFSIDCCPTSSLAILGVSQKLRGAIKTTKQLGITLLIFKIHLIELDSRMDVFRQQGQLDYVAMSNSILSGSLAMSQRLAAAGISQITHQAGLAMCTRFRLGQMGQIRISGALRNLRQYFGFDRVLWFGFGHKSFLALLTEHQAGVNCAALCASLAETYGVDQSALYLQALWRVQGLSETLEPSRSQFRALVNGCSGLLLDTPFPDVMRRMAGPCVDDNYIPVTRVNPRSNDWAKAVDAIFQISKGSLNAVRVYGGRDIAFLGAIAHWLFDLRVWIELPDGTITFSSCRSPEQANVYLHYADVEKQSNALLKISSTTFVLRCIEDLIVDDSYSQMTFRIQWNSCLSELFYGQVDYILKNVVLIGKALGSIARIYEALRKCEADVGGLSRTHFINHQPAGHGRGFIDTICNLFPEIGNSMFRNTALETLKTDVPTCVNEIYDSIREMIEDCDCLRCDPGGDGSNQDHSCIVAVLLFIRATANDMSHTDIKAIIKPSRIGLEQIYSHCYNLCNLSALKECSAILEIATGLPHAEMAGRAGHIYSKDFLLDGLLRGVATIFFGSAHPKEFDYDSHATGQPQCTAVVKDGVCIWINALQNLSADPASIASIHIAPGQIVYKDWNYTSIWDMSHVCEELRSGLSPAHFEEVPTTTLHFEPDQTLYALRILAQERSEVGTIRLVYGLSENPFERTLQPGIITEQILMATARVPCPHRSTCSDELALPCWQRRSGWNFNYTTNGPLPPHLHPEVSHSVGFIWNASSPVSKLLAVEGCRSLAWYNHDTLYRHELYFNSSAILMRSDQCMSCMTRYMKNFADESSWEHLLYYRGKEPRPIEQKDLLCSFHVI